MATFDLLLPVIFSIITVTCFLLYNEGAFKRSSKRDIIFFGFGSTLPFADILQSLLGLQYGIEGNPVVVWLVENLSIYGLAIFIFIHVASSILSLWLWRMARNKSDETARLILALLGLYWLSIVVWNFVALEVGGAI
jgi:hypothetical protein